MSKKFNIAVVGASGVVGEALVAILEERGFPVDELFLLGSVHSAGKRVEFMGRHHRIDDLVDFDFGKTQLAFFAANAALSLEYAPRAVAAGCTVIDCCGAFRYDSDAPLVIPEINPQALEKFQNPGIVANPDPATIQILMTLFPLHTSVGIERIEAYIVESVSSKGRSGIEELAAQTAALLNAQGIETRAFPQQIAFNSLLGVDAPQNNGYTETEMAAVLSIQRILADENIEVSVTTSLAPVFYGSSSVVSVQTRRPLSPDQARKLLAKASGVLLMEQQKPAEMATPVGVVGTDSVYVSRLRQSLGRPDVLIISAVMDNARKGSALNAVQIGEILVKTYL